jgi:hypothetical protein
MEDISGDERGDIKSVWDVGSGKRLPKPRFQSGTVCSVLEHLIRMAGLSKYPANMRKSSAGGKSGQANNETRENIALTLLIFLGIQSV